MIAQQPLHLRYVPQSLGDVIGQPELERLAGFAGSPYATFILFGGEPGTGKTAAAKALARDLGCFDEYTGLWCMNGPELTTDVAKDMMRRTMRLRFGSSSGFNVLLIDELEWLSEQCQRFMKEALDPLGSLPRNVVVIATSNSTKGLSRALLQRFQRFTFDSGMTFRAACQDRLAEIWHAEVGGETPAGFGNWGWDQEAGAFSFREALTAILTHAQRNGVNHADPPAPSRETQPQESQQPENEPIEPQSESCITQEARRLLMAIH